MTALTSRHWWAIERYDTERHEWVLQWSPHRPCWPRLFRTRRDARAEVEAQRRRDDQWTEKHWRQRAVRVCVEVLR